MRAVIQRVSEASVAVEDGPQRSIGPGLLILLGIADGDDEQDGAWMARKIAAMRIFQDDNGRMNRSVREIGGEALVVSQFTLMASTRKGNRPSFDPAASPEQAVPLYEDFVSRLASEIGRPVPTGEFAAAMEVRLLNSGPVTIVLDSRARE